MGNYTKYKIKKDRGEGAIVDRSNVYRGQMDHRTFLRGGQSHDDDRESTWSSRFSQADKLRPEDSFSNIPGRASSGGGDMWNLLSAQGFTEEDDIVELPADRRTDTAYVEQRSNRRPFVSRREILQIILAFETIEIDHPGILLHRVVGRINSQHQKVGVKAGIEGTH